MPELPEVEIIKRGLEKRIKGLVICEVGVRVKKLFYGDKKNIEGARIKNIWRRGKVLGVDLEGDGFPIGLGMTKESLNHKKMTLLVHLKMTGQLVFQGADERIKIVGGHPQKSYSEPLPHKHTHIIINFTDGSKLYFNDLRKFGWMKVVATSEVLENSFIMGLGFEPFGTKIKNQKSKIKMTIKNSKRSIKSLLLDQAIIAGLGNIYSDEVLYKAGVRPDRKANSLENREIEKIFNTIPIVLGKAIKCGGTSDNTFVNVNGEQGDYLKCAAVYHKERDPKGHMVEKMKIGGRTAHFCSFCQR